MFPFPLDPTSQTEDLFIPKAHNINCPQHLHLNTFQSKTFQSKHLLDKPFSSFPSQSSTFLKLLQFSPFLYFSLISTALQLLWNLCCCQGLSQKQGVCQRGQTSKEVRHPQLSIILHFLTPSTTASVSPLHFQYLCPILRFYPISSLDMS